LLLLAAGAAACAAAGPAAAPAACPQTHRSTPTYKAAISIAGTASANS
jgi:hypothetical protein